MSEVVSMISNMKAPGSEPKEKPRRKKKKRVLVFDQVLQHPELLDALESAGFEVVPRTALGTASNSSIPELILAEIHELQFQDRRAIETLRDAHPQLAVVGIGRPVVVALARGRRRARNYPERRRGLPNRRVFDEFVSTPVNVPALLDWIQSWRKLAQRQPADLAESG